MLSVIKTFYDEEGKSRKLFLAGHSLGAALATIAAARLVFEHSDINISAVYSLGGPRYDSDATSHDTKPQYTLD